MAGDWIKWQKGLARKREVMSVAHKLGMDRRAVAAACMEVWEWADDETADGHVEGVPAGVIDQVAGLDGLADALAEVGWLRITEGGVSFPNFDRHNGAPAKKRARKSKDQSRHRSVTTESPPKDHERSTREEKRRAGRQRREPEEPDPDPESASADSACLPQRAESAPEPSLTPEDALRGLGIRDPLRSRLLALDGLTTAEIRSEWLSIGGSPRSPAAVLASRLFEARGQDVRSDPRLSVELREIEALRRAAG